MNLNDLYPSRFLKASDLNGRNMNVVIHSLDKDSLHGESKNVMTFKNMEKQLVLNRTNAELIGELFGPDTDRWVGKSIELHKARVSFQGKLVDAIRVRAPTGSKPGPAGDELNDGLPF